MKLRDQFVSLKKQGKQSRKKHLSKDAIRKIAFKQTVWTVYRHTRKNKDKQITNEALNAATNEIRQSERNYEQKLECNIKK